MADFEPFAASRIPFGIYRGGRLKPDIDQDSFAVLWAKNTRDKFLEACDAHLDDVICEYDQMFLDMCEYAQREHGHHYTSYTSEAKAKFRQELMGRFPFVPVGRTEFATLTEFHECWKSPKVRHVTPVWGRTALTGWRDMDPEDFEETALQHMQELLDGHESMRETFYSVVNRMNDHAGWGYFDLGHWTYEFRMALDRQSR